jgi:hypothetical protein
MKTKRNNKHVKYYLSILSAGALLLAGCTSSFGQKTQASPSAVSEPATKLEAFQSRTGIVRIKGYSEVATIKNVSIDAWEFRDAANPASRAPGIVVEVKEYSSYGNSRENRAFVDADEIDSLLRGIDYISKAEKSVTKFSNFEAIYHTKGDLRITVFNNRNGKIQAAVDCGKIGKTTAFLELTELAKLRDAIALAQSQL